MTKKQHINAAMSAHSNLNVFSLIVSILEGGTITGGDNAAARKIITICKKETIRQLRLMDVAVEKIEGSNRG